MPFSESFQIVDKFTEDTRKMSKVVYLSRRTHDNERQTFGLKKIMDHRAGQEIEEGVKEAKTLSKLNHPNIVQHVYNFSGLAEGFWKVRKQENNQRNYNYVGAQT